MHIQVDITETKIETEIEIDSADCVDFEKHAHSFIAIQKVVALRLTISRYLQVLLDRNHEYQPGETTIQ